MILINVLPLLKCHFFHSPYFIHEFMNFYFSRKVDRGEIMNFFGHLPDPSSLCLVKWFLWFFIVATRSTGIRESSRVSWWLTWGLKIFCSQNNNETIFHLARWHKRFIKKQSLLSFVFVECCEREEEAKRSKKHTPRQRSRGDHLWTAAEHVNSVPTTEICWYQIC